MSEEAKNPVKKAVEAVGDVVHKAVDATILDKSPHGTNVDGFVNAKEAVQLAADATVLDQSPHGTNVDAFVNTKVTPGAAK